MGSRFRLSTVAIFTFVVLAATALPALAGPGGRIASAAFSTPLGKIVLGLLTIILLPLIIWVAVRERMGMKRTLADLSVLGAKSPSFDWLLVRDRVIECFQRVQSAWSREDMGQASQWMTGWYWQNQQLAHLDRWRDAGLVNHCTVKSVGRLRPLFLAVRGSAPAFEGSRLVVAIQAKMEDYLASCETGKVVEGKRGFKDVETVWTLVLEDGRWLVNQIEPDSMTLAYAQLANEVPAHLLQPEAPRAAT